MSSPPPDTNLGLRQRGCNTRHSSWQITSNEQTLAMTSVSDHRVTMTSVRQQNEIYTPLRSLQGLGSWPHLHFYARLPPDIQTCLQFTPNAHAPTPLPLLHGRPFLLCPHGEISSNFLPSTHASKRQEWPLPGETPVRPEITPLTCTTV